MSNLINEDLEHTEDEAEDQLTSSIVTLSSINNEQAMPSTVAEGILEERKQVPIRRTNFNLDVIPGGNSLSQLNDKCSALNYYNNTSSESTFLTDYFFPFFVTTMVSNLLCWIPSTTS